MKTADLVSVWENVYDFWGNKLRTEHVGYGELVELCVGHAIIEINGQQMVVANDSWGLAW